MPFRLGFVGWLRAALKALFTYAQVRVSGIQQGEWLAILLKSLAPRLGLELTTHWLTR